MIRETIFKIARADVDVHVDDPDRGEGAWIDDWEIESLVGATFPDIKSLIEGIAEATGLFSANPIDYAFSADEYVIVHNYGECGQFTTDAWINTDYDVPDSAEIQMWRNGDLTLYNAHLHCLVCVVDRVHSNGTATDTWRAVDESDLSGYPFDIY